MSKRLLTAITLLGACGGFGLAAGPVDYISGTAEDDNFSPAYALEVVCGRAQTLLGITNTHITNFSLLAVSVKLDDSTPPDVKQELVVSFQASNAATCFWATVCLQREVQADAEELSDWEAGLHARKMRWHHLTKVKPDESELGRFIRDCNFGYNEFEPGIKAVYVGVYAPHKALRKVVARGISKDEKGQRWCSYLRQYAIPGM